MNRFTTLANETTVTSDSCYDLKNRVHALIEQGAKLADQESIRDIINADKDSRQKKLAKSARNYYDVQNEFIKEFNFNRFTTILATRDEDGKPDGGSITKTVTANAANRKLAHGIYTQIVSQKASWTIDNKITFTADLNNDSENDKLLKLFEEYINEDFTMDVFNTCINAFNDGQSAWYFFYPKDAEVNDKIRYVPIEGIEVIPVYDKETQTKLIEVIRYYTIVYENEQGTQNDEVVEVWNSEGVEYWAKSSDGDYTLSEYKDLFCQSVQIDGSPVKEIIFDLGKPPFAMLYNNRLRLSELGLGKDLLDEYDYTRSSLSNDIADVKEQLLALSGAQGENADEVRYNLYVHKLLLLGMDQKAEALSEPIQYEARKEHWAAVKDDIFSNFQAVDYNSSAFRTATTGKALLQLTKPLRQKVNMFKPYLDSFLREVVYFIIQDINRLKGTSYTEYDINFSVPMTQIIDSAEVIANTTLSRASGLLDLQTAVEIVVKNLPGNIDPTIVLERLKSEGDIVQLPEDNV